MHRRSLAASRANWYYILPAVLLALGSCCLVLAHIGTFKWMLPANGACKGFDNTGPRQVGWLSYFWATAIFTFAFALVFSFPVDGTAKAKAISLGGSLALGLAVAYGSSLLFRELFLVRLP